MSEARWASVIRISMSTFAIISAALLAWYWRHVMASDGLSYVDIADAYAHGNFTLAISTYWGALYTWVLALALRVAHPAPQWEATMVHAVNFAAFVFAWVCFDYFLRQAIRWHEQSAVERGSQPLPQWVLVAIGYALFTFSALRWITLANVSPDLLVAGFVYLAAALLTRIRIGHTSVRAYAALGVAVGVGYWAKAPMFLVGPVFIALACLMVPRNIVLPRAAAAVGAWLLITAPLVGALSHQRGRLTFSDNAKWNYAFWVNGVDEVHWQGGPPGSGTPIHPTRKLLDSLPVYEFAAPLPVAYAPWYDPPYWYEGVQTHVDIGRQAHVAISNLRDMRRWTFDVAGLLIIGLAVLVAARGRPAARDIAHQWHLLIPAAAGYGMYALVHVEPRMLAAFMTVGLLAPVCALRVESAEYRRAAAAVAVLVLAQLMYVPVAHTGSVARALVVSRGRAAGVEGYWPVAAALRSTGVKPGTWAGYIGTSWRFYWARLAGIRVVAEMRPTRDAPTSYWVLGGDARARVLAALQRAGARIAVIDSVPSAEVAMADGWSRLGTTAYYMRVLPEVISDSRTQAGGEHPTAPAPPSPAKGS
jgi:hypothetical protein